MVNDLATRPTKMESTADRPGTGAVQTDTQHWQTPTGGRVANQSSH